MVVKEWHVNIIRVHGGHAIEGDVHVSGAKNSALKLMAATLLAPGTTTLTNVPNISDVHVMGKVLKGLGATIEVADERAGKHRAMTYLAKRLHIPAEGTAAFGDGDNDAEMLKAAGVGIAMENATALCREAADYVTLSHEKDGVAWGIRKILGL